MTRMFDSRDNVVINVNGVDLTVREKYMSACCTIAIDSNMLHIRDCFHDIYNSGKIRAVYYKRPIESILFLRSPKIYKSEGEIEEILIHDGDEAKLSVEHQT